MMKAIIKMENYNMMEKNFLTMAISIVFILVTLEVFKMISKMDLGNLLGIRGTTMKDYGNPMIEMALVLIMIMILGQSIIFI